jgi:hypothetical protein
VFPYILPSPPYRPSHSSFWEMWSPTYRSSHGEILEINSFSEQMVPQMGQDILLSNHNNSTLLRRCLCQDSSVGKARAYGLDCRASIPGRYVYKRFFSSPQRPDRTDPEWGLKLTTHFHLVLRPRMVELYLHSPICLHGVVLH